MNEVNESSRGDVEIATDDTISRRHFPASLLELSPTRTHHHTHLFVLQFCSAIHCIIDDWPPTEASQHVETDDKARPQWIRRENGPDNNGPVTSEPVISRRAPAARVRD